MKAAFGIDIGGTKIAMALGLRSGKILDRREIKTETKSKANTCIRELIATLKAMLRESKFDHESIYGIGLCMPGAVDTHKGIVPVSPHLEGWQGIPLAKRVSKALRLPVFTANDANAGALGERIFGQAKGKQNFIYITVSTGVGGGLIVNGKLVEGASFVGGEIGHMTIEPEGEHWKLGEVGVLEAYASGTAIAKYVDAQLQKGEGTQRLKLLKKEHRLTTREISYAAIEGDKFAKHAFERAGTYLGIGIGNLLNILNPEMIILGGGGDQIGAAHFFAQYA